MPAQNTAYLRAFEYNQMTGKGVLCAEYVTRCDYLLPHRIYYEPNGVRVCVCVLLYIFDRLFN